MKYILVQSTSVANVNLYLIKDLLTVSLIKKFKTNILVVQFVKTVAIYITNSKKLFKVFFRSVKKISQTKFNSRQNI